MQKILENALDELKTRPFNMLILIGLMVAFVWGLNTFARASDLTRLVANVEIHEREVTLSVLHNSKKIDQILSLQLIQNIRALHSQVCKAGDPMVKRELQRALDEFQTEYAILVGSAYRIGPC